MKPTNTLVSTGKFFLLKKVVFVILCLLVFEVLVVTGEPTYSINGTATVDGRPRPNVRIRATNAITKAQFFETTNPRGIFVFPQLIQGLYLFDMISPSFAHLGSKSVPSRKRRTATGGMVSIIDLIGTRSIEIGIDSMIEDPAAINRFVFDIPSSAIIELYGVIKDQNENPILNARIKLINLSTNTTEEILSKSDGTYEVIELASGEYRVEVSAANFKTESTNLTIVNAETQTKDFKLTNEN